MKRIFSNLMLILLMLTLTVACQKDEVAPVQNEGQVALRTLDLNREALQRVHDALVTRIYELYNDGTLTAQQRNHLNNLMKKLQKAIDKENFEEANLILEDGLLDYLEILADQGVLSDELFLELQAIATDTPLDHGSVFLGGVEYQWKLMEDGNKWLVENLRYPTSDGNGNPTSWAYQGTDGSAPYGLLYTQKAAIDLCPLLGNGWHLPTSDEWYTLASKYGGDWSGSYNYVAYGKLVDPMYGEGYGTSGFNAILGGRRIIFPWGTEYESLGTVGYYWSDMPNDPNNVVYGRSYYFYSWPTWGDYWLTYGWTGATDGQSCRCVLNPNPE